MNTNVFSQTVTVSSLKEMLPYLGQDNVDLMLEPGTYTIDATDVAAGDFGNPLLLFSGNNSTYDFTGVTLKVNTDVFMAFGNESVNELGITGNNNVLKNLTMIDDGTVNDRPYRTALNILMDGESNRVEGFHVTVKGSYPYGYGDTFGKGSGYVIKHFKHSACLVRGNSNHLKNCTFIHRAYGHGIFMQGAVGALIEGCYVEGEVRSTDDMLAETSGPAYDKNFGTVWGYKLPAGYMMSLQEDGIRTYTSGTTVINGITYTDRSTSDITVRNCTVKYMRSGLSLTLGSGFKNAEGCTVIGCETGYGLRGGSIVNCSGDAVYGPVYSNAYDTDKNLNVDITVLPASDPYYNGSQCLAYIGGSGHNITLKGSKAYVDQNLQVQIGGARNFVRTRDDGYAASNIKIYNLTAYPLFLGSSSSGNSGVSGGMVSDFGTNNNVTHISVSVADIEAEDYTAMNGVTTETNGDITHVTSIESDDYMEYEIDVPYAGTYTMDYQVASESNEGNLTISTAGSDIETITFPATGAQTWQTVSSSSSFYLDKGVQTIRVTSHSDGWNFDWMSLLLECAKVKLSPHIEKFNYKGESLQKMQTSEITLFSGSTVSLSSEPAVSGIWSWSGPDGFSADSRSITLSDLKKYQSGEYILTYTNTCGLTSIDTFTINVLDSWLIEAEAYNSMNGVTVESTTDVKGGSDITSIDAGDYMMFSIPEIETADSIEVRVASATEGGVIEVRIGSANGEIISFIDVPNTGSTDSWQTVSARIDDMEANDIYFVFRGEGSELFRLNWLQFTNNDNPSDRLEAEAYDSSEGNFIESASTD